MFKYWQLSYKFMHRLSPLLLIILHNDNIPLLIIRSSHVTEFVELEIERESILLHYSPVLQLHENILTSGPQYSWCGTSQLTCEYF